MCGLYGRIGIRDDALDSRATLTLRHRGPDDAGLWVGPGEGFGKTVALGHTRLSIIDLSAAGHQPMVSADGRHVVTYNGEIYNYKELRRELRADGCVFRSDSDTEVLLHLYARRGDAMLRELAGMYALAIWDRVEKRLLLARDPSGIKPLFYRAPGSSLIGADESAGDKTGDVIAFGSELKSLLVDPRLERRPDMTGLAGFLTYLYVPAPRTAFAGIRRVPPGHKLVVDESGMRLASFQRFSAQPKLDIDDIDTAADRLEDLLQHVVGQHMLADVPVGAFLSGGIDSGLLVAMMAKQKRDRGDAKPLSTFTIGFGAEGHRWDEIAPAAELARHIGVEHNVLTVPPSAAAERFDRIVGQFDEPFANPTAIVHDVLCEGARKHVTVAVAGDGGDEAFAGYPRHRGVRLLQLIGSLPDSVRSGVLGRIAERIPDQAEGPPLIRRARRFLRTGARSFPAAYRGWLNFYEDEELEDLLARDVLAHVATAGPPGQRYLGDLGQTESVVRSYPPDTDPVDLACLADIYGFMPNNVLKESDRTSMRYGLEVRVPFADRRVLDFGLALRSHLKMPQLAAILRSGGPDASKRVLRRVAKRWLPQRTVNAAKQGFGAPMGAWLNTDLADLLAAATAPGTLDARGLVRNQPVQRMVAEHRAGTRDRTWNLWSLVVLEDWYRRRIDRLDLPATDDMPITVQVAAS